VTLWSRLAEITQQHLGEGSSVFIEGRLQQEVWQDKRSGQKRSRLRVVAEKSADVGPAGIGRQTRRASRSNLTNKSRCASSAIQADPFHVFAGLWNNPENSFAENWTNSLFRGLKLYSFCSKIGPFSTTYAGMFHITSYKQTHTK
jgi:single-stranded DNA-binding protein